MSGQNRMRLPEALFVSFEFEAFASVPNFVLLISGFSSTRDL
jgi:hypothetical protein